MDSLFAPGDVSVKELSMDDDEDLGMSTTTGEEQVNTDCWDTVGEVEPNGRADIFIADLGNDDKPTNDEGVIVIEDGAKVFDLCTELNVDIGFTAS